jgi:mgtE-like transporter
VLYQNVLTGVATTFSSSLYLAVLARMAAVAFGYRSISLLQFVTISVVGGLLGSAVIMALTIGLSVLAHRRNYDLDTVSTPLVTAAGDMVTVPTLFLATFVARVHAVNTITAWICITACVFVTIQGFLTRLPMARRAIYEMVGVILLTPVLDILAGTVIERRLDQFHAFPALVAIIAPLVSDAGAIGGIFASRVSSKLHLGVLSPRGRPGSAAYLDASLVGAFGMIAFLLVGTSGYVYSLFVGRSPGPGVMIGGTLLVGVISTLIAVVVGYLVAVVSFRFRLDPDNQSVPIITSVMDLAGVITFLLVLDLLRVTVRV